MKYLERTDNPIIKLRKQYILNYRKFSNLLLKFVIVWCVQWNAIVLFSQEITPDEDSEFFVEEFTLPGGTNGNLVTSIKEGPKGYMWFGSFAGLHRYDGYEFITYNDENADSIKASTGLTFPNVEHLFWDSNDQLWVCTFGGGIFLFDPIAETFKHFEHDPEDSTTISSSYVHYAAEDSDGNLWFGTRATLDRFNPETETFDHYIVDPTQEPLHQNNRVRVLYVDRKGTLWATAGEVWQASRIGGLYRYDPNSDSFIGYFPDPDKPGGLGYAPIRGMYEDSDGNFWVGTFYGLQKMDREKGTFENMPYDPHAPHSPGVNERLDAPVWSMVEDQNKGLWIGTVSFNSTENNVLRYDPVKQTTELFPVSTMAWDIAESSDGTIWVAGSAIQGHVSRIIRQDKTYDIHEGRVLMNSLENDNSNPISGLLNFTIDKNTGTHWALNGVVDGITSSVFLTAQDDINTAPVRYNLEGVSPAFTNSSGFANVGMEVGKDGKIWGVINEAGLLSYDPSTEVLKRYLHNPSDSGSLSSNEIVRMIMDSRGELWAAGYLGGLNRLNPETGTITKYNFGNAADRKDHFFGNPTGAGDDNFPIALLEDKNGMIWVGGALDVAGGLVSSPFITVINPDNNERTNIPLPEKMQDSYVASFAEDPVTGNIAFGLYQYGFAIYNIKEKSIKHYHPNDGLSDGSSPFRNIASLLYDETGILWIAARTPRASFARLDLDKDNSFIFKSSELANNGSRNAFVSPEGHMIFVNNMGWSRIKPNEIIPPDVSRVSKIQLVEHAVLGQKQKVAFHSSIDSERPSEHHIFMDHTAESFSFRFSDFNYQISETEFQYRLLPYEMEWRKSDFSPTANYFKVPPGNYEFQVKARSPSGTIIEPLSLKVTIDPPWWKTWWAYTLYALAIVLLGLLVHKTQKERTIRIERERTKDRELAQAKEIEKAYSELKVTQAQLIQSEKMASLGELTAGIAHEIQNPLNFVNNFSEVSNELLDEMKEVVAKGNTKEVEEIIGLLSQNIEKIHHHGERASSIVKGMLQHSRASKGEKEPTNINALCEEYLRLAYHGIRAKDRTFNAKMETTFDESLKNIEVIPQDIGRVILNLITNAFYTVNERKKKEGADYQPCVSINTKVENNRAMIKVSDNGTGIPKDKIDKIFQPFFTTKPTGQGTGLGLSLSYDIITKGHGGQLKVDTKKGEGSTFIIILPL